MNQEVRPATTKYNAGRIIGSHEMEQSSLPSVGHTVNTQQTNNARNRQKTQFQTAEVLAQQGIPTQVIQVPVSNTI